MWQFGEYRQYIYLGSSVEKSLTNSELLEKAWFLATGLRIHGIRKGEVVAILLSNIPEIPEIPEIINGGIRMGDSCLTIVFMFTHCQLR